MWYACILWPTLCSINQKTAPPRLAPPGGWCPAPEHRHGERSDALRHGARALRRAERRADRSVGAVGGVQELLSGWRADGLELRD